MNFLVKAHYLPECMDHDLIAGVFDPAKIGFEPVTIGAPGFRKRKYTPNALEKFRTTPWAGRAELKGSDRNNSAEFFETFFDWHSTAYPANLCAVDHLATVPGFIMGAAGDAEDFVWQSETSIDYYETFKRPHEHLPRREGVFGIEIDTSKNPGRASMWVEHGITLWATASLWFGRPSFSYFSEEKLLSSPVGTVTVLPNSDTIRIDLYDPTTDNEDVIRERQRVFRDWMNYDKLETELPYSESIMEDDPQIEILYGSFPHGGSMRYIEYLNDKKKPTCKSKATLAFVIERNDTGDLIYKAFEPVTKNRKKP